uniref:Fibronectin type-III domain-containing protein n=1 Tax=Oryctolagus cuniculus TaxID=9986 RepID=A0A5F9CQJ5_RABIT
TEDGKSCCFNIEKPVVSDIQTRSAIISWNLHDSEKYHQTEPPVTFELAISNSGKDGKYENIYIGNGLTFTLLDLQPSMDYFLRVTTIRDSQQRTVSEVVSFSTPGCEPDPPLPPTLINRSKSSLNLQWNGSNDNGSKINSFLLEWDEGKGKDFKSCYTGTMKQHKILKLNASTKYSFRLAAKNNFGLSDFSEIAVFHTSGIMPPAPSPPKLKAAGICNLSLEWCAPANTNPNLSLTYVLEMEEAGSGLGFKPKYNGEDLSCTVRNLQRSTTYKFRIFAYNMEGRSNSSGEVKFTTCPDKPGSPTKPYIKGKIHAHKVKIGWEPPTDNGGTHISSYSLEVSENLDVNFWNIVYTGNTREFLYNKLQPGTTYNLRVFCTSPVGQSQPSDILTIQTPALSPAYCQPSPLNGKTKSTETKLQCEKPPADINFDTLIHVKKAKNDQEDTSGHPGSEVRCTAVNTVGVGMFGITGVVTTPATVPAVVPMLHEVEKKVSTKLASSCIAIQWEEPDCHGSPITGYNIEYGDRKILTIGRKTECVLKNLQPDTIYKIRIQAINHYGLSPFSRPIRTKTKPLPLEPPQLDCVAYGHQSLKLKWGYSSAKGLLSNLINYNLFMYSRSGRFSVIYHGPSQTHKVQRLGEYTQYKFKIQACNEAGEGPLSRIYTFKTTKTPPAILKAPKLHQLNNNICKIKWESLKPIKGDPVIYNLQLISDKGTNLIYKGPNTSFSFSNFLSNTRYRFKVCAGRQYKISTGMQEIWGPYSPSTLFSTHKPNPRAGRGGKGNKGSGSNEQKGEKSGMEINDNIFVLILMMGFALTAILCAVVIQSFLIK